MKRNLGNVNDVWPTTLLRRSTAGASNLTMFNCTIFGAEAHPVVHLGGSGVVFENNLMEWNDWTAVTGRAVAWFNPTQADSTFGKYGSGAFTLEMDRSYVPDARSLVIRNTIHHSGASAGIGLSARSVDARLNHVHHQYAIQEDGGLIQESGLNDNEPAEWGLINAQNWVHMNPQPMLHPYPSPTTSTLTFHPHLSPSSQSSRPSQLSSSDPSRCTMPWLRDRPSGESALIASTPSATAQVFMARRGDIMAQWTATWCGIAMGSW